MSNHIILLWKRICDGSRMENGQSEIGTNDDEAGQLDRVCLVLCFLLFAFHFSYFLLRLSALLLHPDRGSPV